MKFKNWNSNGVVVLRCVEVCGRGSQRDGYGVVSNLRGGEREVKTRNSCADEVGYFR